MITSKTRNSKIEELRKQLEAAEAEQKAEAKKEELEVRRSQRAAGSNHTKLVLSLYDLLGVEPEHPGSRVVDGKARSVAVDKDEAVRCQRLFDMVEALAEGVDTAALDRLQREDSKDRDSRKPKAKVLESVKPADVAPKPEFGGEAEQQTQHQQSA